MPNPKMTEDKALEAVRVYERCLKEGFRPVGSGVPGMSAGQEAARRLKLTAGTFGSRLKAADRLYNVKPNNELYKPLKNQDSGLPSLEERIRSLLVRNRKVMTLEELSDHFDVGISTVRKSIEGLIDRGLNISIRNGEIDIPDSLPMPVKPLYIDVSKFHGKRLLFGVTGDNHLCSKYERLDVLNALFDIWHEQGVETVLQCGNMLDGEARFNRFDLLEVGAENQIAYFLRHWPARPGMKTLFVAGDDHEGGYVQREGLDIGKLIVRTAKDQSLPYHRDDLEYLGYMERDIVFDSGTSKQIIRLMHAGGGTAYAISYTSQKIVESLQGGEKPQILLIGHYHKFDISYPRNVYTVQVGCTQDQTPFMRKRKLEAHVGGVTLAVTLGQDGLFHDITAHWHPFFDREFYKGWKYQSLVRSHEDQTAPKPLLHKGSVLRKKSRVG
jgi:hypothetical protein